MLLSSVSLWLELTTPMAMAGNLGLPLRLLQALTLISAVEKKMRLVVSVDHLILSCLTPAVRFCAGDLQSSALHSVQSLLPHPFLQQSTAMGKGEQVYLQRKKK